LSRSLKFQIVEQARALIAEESHWCRGDLARDANGVGVCPTSDSAKKRCGLGALIMAAYQIMTAVRRTILQSKLCDRCTGAPRSSMLMT
jgi:hypothetical protein